MIRGTTAQFRFKLPCNVSDVEIARIKFWQNGNSGPSKSRPLPIIKVLPQCSEYKVNELLVSLNPEETLRFSEKRRAYVQLRARTLEGTTFGCKPYMLTVYPLYDDSILDGDIVPTPGPGDDEVILLDASFIT